MPGIGDEDDTQSYEQKISNQFLHVPAGHHYLVLYSNIEIIRKVYIEYVRAQIAEVDDSVIIFLSYYDSTEDVRRLLDSKGINVSEREKTGSIMILDIVKVINNPFFEVPQIERLKALAKKVENEFKDKTIFIIADMSVFHHLRRASELLEYEKTLHDNLRTEKWKELCLYHKSDFETMFTKEQSSKLMEYHKDKVILV